MLDMANKTNKQISNPPRKNRVPIAKAGASKIQRRYDNGGKIK
jgi:hypothetical protein